VRNIALATERAGDIVLGITKKSYGGARIITYHLVVNIDETKIYLLSIYDKSKQDSISKQEIEDLKKQNNLI
jgi:hypothetical protein